MPPMATEAPDDWSRTRPLGLQPTTSLAVGMCKPGWKFVPTKHIDFSDKKQKIDVFKVKDPNAPTLIYFHGGYWQRGDKSIYSFLAPSFNSEGVNFITVGYDLCPTVSIIQISSQAREAIAFI